MGSLKLPRRLATRFASMGARPNALVWQPEPPEAGRASAAQRMAESVWLLEGRLVECRAQSPWHVAPPDAVWRDALHGQGWLDDAAAANDAKIWQTLSEHTWKWLDLYAEGTGPGWAPHIVARRLIRWIAYSAKLLQGRERTASEVFFRALGTQTRYLGWRWHETRAGVERVEALTGLLYAVLSLEGCGVRTDRTVAQLGDQARRIIRPDGSITSRSPEELARILALLVWSRETLEATGLTASSEHVLAIQRAAATVRLLAYPSGTLPRFHGGRSGAHLPLAKLTGMQVRASPGNRDIGMGFLRMTAGSTRLVLDSAQVPMGHDARTGHSSALAFEVHDNAHPVIANCGSGTGFGPDVAIAARRAEAHSTVELGGRGAGQFLAPDKNDRTALLSVRGEVSHRHSHERDGQWALAVSKHYVTRLGLQVERRLHLLPDGSRLSGEDTALAIDAPSRAKVSGTFPDPGAPCPMVARFHLHPDVSAARVLSGRGFALTLKDGTLWVLKTDAEDQQILPSQYFDEDRPQPRATSQIVATTRVLDYWGRITWSLERLPRE